MVTRLARLIIRLRYPIVALWLAAAAGAALLLPTIQQAQVGALGDLVPNDAAAIQAERRANELFGFPLLGRTVVVQRDADGLSLAAQREVIEPARPGADVAGRRVERVAERAALRGLAP